MIASEVKMTSISASFGSIKGELMHVQLEGGRVQERYTTGVVSGKETGEVVQKGRCEEEEKVVREGRCCYF